MTGHSPSTDNEPLVSRRPIAARSSAWASAGATGLLKIGLRPNQVSVASIAFAGLSAYAMIASVSHQGWPRAFLLIGAAAGIAVRALCNLFDGMMAIEGGLKSRSGEVFNDFPDRLSDSLMLIGAGYAATWLSWYEIGWLAALLAALTAYTRILGAVSGAGHDFRGPMAKPIRMAFIGTACLTATLEPLWGGEGQSFTVALVAVCAGCIVTMVRRLLNTIRILESS